MKLTGGSPSKRGVSYTAARKVYKKPDHELAHSRGYHRAPPFVRVAIVNAKSAVYEITHPLLAMVRSNRLLIRCLFGVRIPRGMNVSFDPTTVALRHAVHTVAGKNDRHAFEMGIGQAALVSLSLARSRNILISGADCSASRVESSRQVAAENNIDVDFRESDLFTSMPEDSRFDLIFFNVPYVPSELGKKMQLTKRLNVDGDQVWDGGSDGTKVLRRFLEDAKPFLSNGGRVVFGVQHIFVPDDLACEVIHDAGYVLSNRVTKRFVPSCCYVVQLPANT